MGFDLKQSEGFKPGTCGFGWIYRGPKLSFLEDKDGGFDQQCAKPWGVDLEATWTLQNLHGPSQVPATIQEKIHHFTTLQAKKRRNPSTSSVASPQVFQKTP